MITCEKMMLLLIELRLVVHMLNRHTGLIGKMFSIFPLSKEHFRPSYT